MGGLIVRSVLSRRGPGLALWRGAGSPRELKGGIDNRERIWSASLTTPKGCLNAGSGVLESCTNHRFLIGEKKEGKKHTASQDALNSLVAPVQIRLLDIAKGEVEGVDDMVDRLACVGCGRRQSHNPRVEVPRECPEYMHIEVVLGGSGDGER